MMFSLRTRYFQFLEHCRQHGFLSACRLTVYKHEEMVPTVKDLGGLRLPQRPRDADVQFVELGPETFPAAGLHIPLRSRRDRALTYFRSGYRMIAMVRDGEVIGDLWFVTRDMARGRRVHPHLDWFGIELGAGDVYMFDLQVDPGQRGGGITTFFMSSALQMMKERGLARAYGCFVAENIPAMWMHRLIGYRELPRFVIRRIFLYETARAKG
jgi:GNAT superfamily N-acetyltransferase